MYTNALLKSPIKFQLRHRSFTFINFIRRHQSYRSALYAYSINLVNSVPILLDKRLPMSLVTRESLLAVLDSVHDSQKHSTDPLSLAIPMKDLMSYYDAKLVYEIVTVEQGLLLI